MTPTNWIVPHAQRRGTAGGIAFPASSTASTSAQYNAGRGQTRPGSPVQEPAGSSQMQEEEDLSQTQYSPPVASAQHYQQQQQYHYALPQYDPHAQAHPSPPPPSQFAPVHSQSRRNTSFARPPTRANTTALHPAQSVNGAPQVPFYSLLKRSKTGAKRGQLPVVSSASPPAGASRPTSRAAYAAPAPSAPPPSSQAHTASMLTSLSNVVTVLERQSQSLAKLERALGESAKAHDQLGERFAAFETGKQESEQRLVKLIIDGIEQQRKPGTSPVEEARQAEAEKRSERERARWMQDLLTEVVAAVKREVSNDAGAHEDLRKDLMTLRDGLQESLATFSRKIDTVATSSLQHTGSTQDADLLGLLRGIAASQQALRDRLPQVGLQVLHFTSELFSDLLPGLTTSKDIENAVKTALKPLQAFLPVFQSNLAQQQTFQTQLFDLIKLQISAQPAALTVPEHVPDLFRSQNHLQVPQAHPQHMPAARPSLPGPDPPPSISQQQRPPPRNPQTIAMHDRTQTSPFSAQGAPFAAGMPVVAHDQHPQPAAGGRTLTSTLGRNKSTLLSLNGRKILPLQGQALPPSDHQVSDISSAAPSATTDSSSLGYRSGLGARSTAATELIANSQMSPPSLAVRVEGDVLKPHSDSHATFAATPKLPTSHAQSHKQQQQQLTNDLPANIHSQSVKAGLDKLNQWTDKENQAIALPPPLPAPPGTNSTVAPSMDESQLLATYAKKVPSVAEPAHPTSLTASPAVPGTPAADYAPPTPPVSSSPSTAVHGIGVSTMSAPASGRPAKVVHPRKREIFQYSSGTSDDEEEVLGTDQDMRDAKEADDDNAAGAPTAAGVTITGKAPLSRVEVVALSRPGAADASRDSPGFGANNADRNQLPTAPSSRTSPDHTDSPTSLDSGDTSVNRGKGQLPPEVASATTTRQIVEQERAAKRRAMPDAGPQPSKYAAYALTSSSSSSEEADDMADEDYSEQRGRKAPARGRGRPAGAPAGTAPVPAATAPTIAPARGGARRAIKGGGAAQRKKLPIRNAK